jgi:hypothetical protein
MPWKPPSPPESNVTLRSGHSQAQGPGHQPTTRYDKPTRSKGRLTADNTDKAALPGTGRQHLIRARNAIDSCAQDLRISVRLVT